MANRAKTVRNEEWGPYTSDRRVDITALPPMRDAGGVTDGLDEVLRSVPEADLERALDRLAGWRALHRLRPGDDD